MFEKKIKLLDKLQDCARKAGIAEYQFISFGTLLGAVRPSLRRPQVGEPYYSRGFIDWDTDADVGFLADKFHPLQRLEYFNYCHEMGMMSHWTRPAQRIQKRQDNEDILWFSAKLGKNKCCQWFFFEHKGYQFHSKGFNWTAERKFPMRRFPRKEGIQALCLGAPAKLFDKLMPIEFEGLTVNVPVMAGSLLDFWYKGWAVPKTGGASAKKIILVVDRWKEPKSWKLL